MSLHLSVYLVLHVLFVLDIFSDINKQWLHPVTWCVCIFLRGGRGVGQGEDYSPNKCDYWRFEE